MCFFSMPRSGCSALHGVNPSLKRKEVFSFSCKEHGKIDDAIFYSEKPTLWRDSSLRGWEVTLLLLSFFFFTIRFHVSLWKKNHFLVFFHSFSWSSLRPPGCVHPGFLKITVPVLKLELPICWSGPCFTCS